VIILFITALVFFLLVVFDQGVKFLASYIDPNNPIVLGNFVKFTYKENPGAAFGLASEYGWVLVVVSAIATIILGGLAIKNDWKHGKFNAIGVTMAFAGCVGNLIDRIIMLTPERGGVIDMISFGPWNWFVSLFGQGENTFNVADVLLIFGLIMVIIDYLFFYDKRARKYGYHSKRSKSRKS
jgi:signal peptidase II